MVVILASGCHAGQPQSRPLAQIAPRFDPRGLPVSFDERFAKLDIGGPRATWKTNYAFGAQTGAKAIESRALAANGELEVYVDPWTRGTGLRPLGVDPFTLTPEGLRITAARAPADASRLLWGRRYTSGLLTTERSFAQTYGYFEVRAALPRVQGLWPAFWLLPTDDKGAAEIDVLEAIGGDAVYHTVYSGPSDAPRKAEFATRLADIGAFHTYGVLWTARSIAFFVDGVRTASTPTPPDLRGRAMYLLVDLAVGGHWPGRPAADFRSAAMIVRFVRAYRLAPSPLRAERSRPATASTGWARPSSPSADPRSDPASGAPR